MEYKKFFREAILNVTGSEPRITDIRYLGGGCINNSAILQTDIGGFFMKFNTGIPSDMFEKESLGLTLLSDTGIFDVPWALGYGKIEDIDYLLLELINTGIRKMGFWEDFGSKLAKLHKGFSVSQFGLDHNNYIGRLAQVNTWRENWLDFFIMNRLEFQLKIAMDSQLISNSLSGKFEAFYRILPGLLPLEKPSLLHGDLWSGNFMTGIKGDPVLIDPAVYYGHRESELAFTKMFGGFEEEFYRSYNDTFALEKGFSGRIGIYNIYPSLVHLNLFGSAYLPGIQQVINHYV